MTDDASARPEPQTEAEYEAAFDLLMAEADGIHERMRRDHIGSDREEIERLKTETQVIMAETRALLASMGARL